jgi:hypothetical protein
MNSSHYATGTSLHATSSAMRPCHSLSKASVFRCMALCIDMGGVRFVGRPAYNCLVDGAKALQLLRCFGDLMFALVKSVFSGDRSFSF